MAIISLLALAADGVSILTPNLRRHQGHSNKRDEEGKKEIKDMSDGTKSSRGAAKKPHFKPLACQRCWTRRSIVVWELCHSLSLHRAAASEELTNLSLCRDQGKMSATTDDACVHCCHWTEHFSLSVPVQHHQHTQGARWGASAAGW